MGPIPALGGVGTPDHKGPPLDQILLLPADHRAEAVLAPALSSSFRVRAVRHFKDLVSALATDDPQACILDVFHPPPPIPLDSLKALRRLHPIVALVVASDFTGREMDLYRLGRMAIDGVIRFETRPSRREILGVVDGAIASALARRVLQALAGSIPPLAQDALRWGIEHAEARPQVSDMAAALALGERGLRREFGTLGVVSPRTLLIWGRLIRASDLLERDSETVESVAYHLGYATGGALGKALKRHTGCSPTDLIKQGGLSRTLQLIKQHGLLSTRHGR